MKVLITGNMGAGKSFLAKRIVKSKPEVTYVAVDNFRRQIGDGSMAKESQARAAFLNAIQQPGPMLIECMGLGDLGLEVLEALEGDVVSVVLLSVSLEQCLQRLSQRTWDVPYPGTPETGLNLCRHSHDLYELQEIERRFHNLSFGGVHVFPHTTEKESSMIQAFILKLLDQNEPI